MKSIITITSSAGVAICDTPVEINSDKWPSILLGPENQLNIVSNNEIVRRCAMHNGDKIVVEYKD